MSEVIEVSDFVSEATGWIAGRIADGQRDGRIFRLSLCGGSTPKAVYESLARRPEIDWSRVLITFGDERCVPPDHPDSNFRMAKASLLDPAGIPDDRVVRMEGERDPAEAAARCEERLGALAGETGEPVFRHDLVLLGMGEDGHTASLFPETKALEEDRRWVVENFVPKLESTRLTFTFPLIDAADEVAFLIKGEGKRPIVGEVLGGTGDHPAGRVNGGKTVWLLG